MATDGRFYVYEAIGENGECLYIGKGVGRRIDTQRRRFGCLVRVVRWFKSEDAAFRFEKREVASREPIFNKVPGGGGGRVTTPAPRKPRPTKMDREIKRLGTRVYVARMLLGFDLRGHLDPSKIEAVRQVAYGGGV